MSVTPGNRLVLILLFLVSCGPSKEEQKAHEDLIRDAAEKATAFRFAQISKLKDSINSTEAAIEATSNLLVIRKADLEASRDKLNTIRGFQLLRTPEEREQQIRDQMIIVGKLENEVINLATKVEHEKASVATLKKKLKTFQ